ncbi:AzlD domain-containing protein [Anaeromyxobacter oryzisoli]|uniref:AzlD domain-containing protein n=1 Tax=Anaeromyxobacter oryzisoli TaxID=2925408 RepID=UPI001F58A117|nr:AzlD domain-containing protein [Anaeromyxobacter sp. SG63]
MSWLPVLAVAGLVTFATRASFIALLGRVDLPPVLGRALRFVPPAVLSAIIFPEVLLHDGAPDLHLRNVRLLAGVIAAVVAWRTRNVVLTIAVGMAALWTAQAVLGA